MSSKSTPRSTYAVIRSFFCDHKLRTRTDILFVVFRKKAIALLCVPTEILYLDPFFFVCVWEPTKCQWCGSFESGLVPCCMNIKHNEHWKLCTSTKTKYSYSSFHISLAYFVGSCARTQKRLNFTKDIRYLFWHINSKPVMNWLRRWTCESLRRLKISYSTTRFHKCGEVRTCFTNAYPNYRRAQRMIRLVQQT